MIYRNSEFYDDKVVFKKYIKQRRSKDNLNDIIEKPVLLEIIGKVKGKKVLDLGCGDGEIGFDFVEQDCLSYTGVDGSQNMIDFAKNNFSAVKSVHFERSLLQDWDFPREKYNLVISRMSLHYLLDIADIFQKVYNALEKEGQFVFSVEHPFFTYKNYSKDYYNVGGHICNWFQNDVIKNHRKIEDYFNVLQETGFTVTGLRENKSVNELDEGEKKMPLVLFLRAKKV